MSLSQCLIVTAGGGDGGKGSDGQLAGTAGLGFHLPDSNKGSPYDPSQGEASNGCAGGDGSAGGAGGPGGGGQGGPSIGIVLHNGSVVTKNQVEFSIGPAGLGGASSGQAGADAISSEEYLVP